MPGKSSIQPQIRDQIAVYYQEVAVDKGALVHITKNVADGARAGHADELHDAERGGPRCCSPAGARNVLLYPLSVSAAVDKDFRDTVECEEFEGVVY